LLSKYLDLTLYVLIALGIQYLVFILHGYPFNSEKYYDLSGSITHFAVVAASLVYTASEKSPRQIMVALASVIWMTRLGSFLFLRIAKDGRDERFDPIKKSWVSFLGAWSIQALWVVLT
jgi:steroid 5-alpha reductase family enzyme